MYRFYVFLLSLLIVSCSGDDSPGETEFDSPLEGNWALLRYENADGQSILDTPEKERLTEFNFQANGTLNIKSTCNLISADYSNSSNSIQIENFVTTLVGCLSEWEAKLYNTFTLSQIEPGLYELGFSIERDTLLLQFNAGEFMYLEKIME